LVRMILRRAANPSARHRTGPRYDWNSWGAALFASFFSAKGAGLDAALPNFSVPFDFRSASLMWSRWATSRSQIAIHRK
jgi:hypothetical protein